MKYPLIHLTSAFALGIVFAFYVPVSSLSALIYLLLVLFFAFISFSSSRSYLPYIFLAAAFLLGNLRMQVANESRTQPLFENYFIRGGELYGTIATCELPARGGLIFSITADSIKFGDTTFVSNKQLLVNLYEDTVANMPVEAKLKPGNKIYALGNYYRFKPQGNPFEWKEDEYYSRLGYSGRFRITKPDSMKILDSTVFIYETAVLNIRHSIDKKLRSLFSGDAYGLLRGLLLADRRGMSSEKIAQFSEAGVIHVLAVSGLHIGFIAFIMSALFSRVQRSLRELLVIAGLFLYLLIIGFPVTALRAFYMISIYLLGRNLQRSPNPIHSVFAAALLILFINPSEIFTVGFQLSFSAVLGILLFYPLFEKRLEINAIKSSAVKFVAASFFVSIAAQTGVALILLYHFSTVPLMSVFANIPVIPLIGFILTGGILSITCSYAIYALGALFASFTNLLFELLSYIVSFFVEMRDIAFKAEIVTLPGLLCLILLIVLLYIILNSNTIRNLPAFVSGVLIFSLYPIYKSFITDSLFPRGELSVLFMDAGQGDAVLISTPNGKKILIDGGLVNPYVNTAVRKILPILRRTGDGNIDLAIVSHYDADHYGGAVGLLNLQSIKTIILPEKEEEILIDDDIYTFARLKKATVITARDTSFMIDNVKIFVMESRWQSGGEKLHTNNKGLSVKLQYGKSSFLLTGDAYAAAENALVQVYGDFLKSDIFKAGHHGSKTSNSDLLLDVVRPQYAVISCGLGNRYNHPSPEVVERFTARNIKLTRTDIEGAVLFTSNGNSVRKKNW